MLRNEDSHFFCGNEQYTDDVNFTDGKAHEDTCDVDVEPVVVREAVDVEQILLSMCNADTQTNHANRKEIVRAKNRVFAQEARDADRMFIELLLVELSNIAETFEMYATYIAQLKSHATAAECGRELERRCFEHKQNIQKLQTCGDDSSRAQRRSRPTKTRKERNRESAEMSRYRKSKFVDDVMRERDASLITLRDVMKYTATLESSCSLLNDFYETGHDFIQLIQVRQRLFQRTCTHTQQCETLKSRLSFRVMYRSSFR